MLLSASVLGADFGHLYDQTQAALDAGCAWVHIDVMDGHFVPNLSFGVPVMQSLTALCRARGALLDVHLMIEQPDRYLRAFAEAGAGLLTVHQEACPHLHRTLQAIHELGCQAGVALNPATPVGTLEDVLPDLDLVLVMSVNPGFAGQAFIPATLGKLRRLRALCAAQGIRPLVQVDGGVTPANARANLDAGADVLVAASALFKGDLAANVRAFQQAAQVMV